MTWKPDWRDLIAGVSVAGLMLPEAVAYAGIAGLPPQRAILAAIAGSLAYVAVGRSRFAIVAPTSSSAAILAAALATLPGDGTQKAVLATLAVVITGSFFLIAALGRLGRITSFIARPVLRGFAFGLAITIILRQLPTLLGLDLHEPNIFKLVLAIASSVQNINLASASVGVAALLVLLAMKRVPAIPGASIVLLSGVAVSYLFELQAHHVAVVGLIDARPSWPVFPHVQWSDLSQLAQLTLPLALILFAESWGTMRSLALRHGDTLSANRELTALGIANMASALVQGMPVAAGFSAGSASEAAGATSKLTGIIAALSLAALVGFAAWLVAYLPQPVLAAVVIAALTHALNIKPLLQLWRLDRDQYVAIAATAGVIGFGVTNGMLIAIGLSLASLLRRLASPQILQLGRIASSHDYVALDRHPEAVVLDGLAIWRPVEPLFFANAESILTAVEAAHVNRAGTESLIVSLEETFDLDSTALEALCEFDTRMQGKVSGLHYARVRDRVRDLVTLAGNSTFEARCHFSVADAVQTCRHPRASGSSTKS